MKLSHRLPAARYICNGCVQNISNTIPVPYRINGLPGLMHGFSTASSSVRCFGPSRRAPHLPRTQTSFRRLNAYSSNKSKRPLRVAIIGSGPAGFYSAYRLMTKLQDAVVDMYEQLPVPYGLVRFGVAPDHPEVKNCQDKFEEVAESPRFNYIGNVRVGSDLDLARMKPHYDAFLFSYGASEDKKLWIPGEDLPGVFSAREFVGWYNGLPQFQHLAPDLEAGDQAVVVGQGNVALDVARILLTPLNLLRHTDITEQALQTLDRSKVRSVRVVGRRGPLQAAFTVKEVRELMNIVGVAFEPINRSFYPEDIKKLPRIQRRIAEVLSKGTEVMPSNAGKSWALDFLLSPKLMNASRTSNQLSSVTFTKMAFPPDTDTTSKLAPVVSTNNEKTIPASLAFRSVGYKSSEIPGLSDLDILFDNKLGIIPNDAYGRVIMPSAEPSELAAGHVPGCYCAGWVKRGPTGVIASTMDDAFTSADVIVSDWESGVPFLNSDKGDNASTGLGWDGVKKDVIEKGIRPISWEDWKRIDAREQERGKHLGKVREKFSSVEEMLKIFDS